MDYCHWKTLDKNSQTFIKDSNISISYNKDMIKITAPPQKKGRKLQYKEIETDDFENIPRRE